MKKTIILFSTLALTYSLNAGVINYQFNEINKNTKQLDRIEKKLDLIINEMIKEEIAAENRQKVLENVVETGKDTVNAVYEEGKGVFRKAGNWISNAISGDNSNNVQVVKLKNNPSNSQVEVKNYTTNDNEEVIVEEVTPLIETTPMEKVEIIEENNIAEPNLPIVEKITPMN